MVEAPPLHLPIPRAIELRRRATGKPPLVPFGLASWSTEPADAIAVDLEVPASWGATGLGEVAEIAAQLPEASSVAPGTLLIVFEGEPASSRGLLGRFFKGRGQRIARAVRGSALLARGYTGVGGGVDPASGYDLIWGFSERLR